MKAHAIAEMLLLEGAGLCTAAAQHLQRRLLERASTSRS